MTMPRISRVTAVKVVGSTQLELRFEDGLVNRIDLAPALWGPVFEPLRNPEYFQQVRLEDDTIRWPNDADFCPDVLRFWCEAGGVRSPKETDEHFAAQAAASAAS
jgi:hypothetical protein